ncbi:MAG: transcriptional regulator, TetR family [Solirubrobacterales bacterium]|nr:transcriptional regulator, TetR family [Solirubrobacterales bacterium]
MSERLAPRSKGASDRVRRVDARRNLQAIIEAAVPLLCEHPRASMQQIAAAAGLHRATVHRHFPSRDDLLEELRQRAFSASSEALNAVRAAPSSDPGQTLLRATAALVQVGDQFRLYRYTTWRSADTDGPAELIGAGLVELVGAAQAVGAIRTDLPAEQLVAAMGGLIWAMLPQVADGQLTVDGAAGMIRTLLGAPGA